jgi:hypothetical protein
MEKTREIFALDRDTIPELVRESIGDDVFH